MKPRMHWLDRITSPIAPRWTLSRAQARMALDAVRHFEAASVGRRTQNWSRRGSDANLASRSALAALRDHSRDLVRNNSWARNGIRVIPRNVVGWGITPKAIGITDPTRIMEPWAAWAGSTDCDAAGRLTFAGLQKLVTRGVAESGEMLIRRRWRRPEDGLALPVQLQVLEPDYLDATQDNRTGIQGGPVIQGVEFDAIGRRVAYWLHDRHPGSSMATPTSKRIDARDVIHVFDMERAGQDRGVPWLCSAIVKIKDFDEFEDAQLMRQKIAACFAALVTDDGDGTSAVVGEASSSDPLVETIEPGMILRLPAGKQVSTANPPMTTDDGFSVRTLRAIAAGIGVTYEDLTCDYSQVNFSSARMSRLAHWGNVYDWQWNMVIPQFCDPAWGWAMDAAVLAGFIGASERPRADWTPQPMPMTDPDAEARANVVMMRSGQKTLSQVIREQGGDPDAVLEEIAEDNAKLDAAGIWLDSDPRRVSQAGLSQARTGSGADAGSEPTPPPPGKANGVQKPRMNGTA